jgi:hypothetical protein
VIESKATDKFCLVAEVSMGSWGNENFEDDASLDTLDDLFDSLISSIRETFKLDPIERLYDGYGDSKIIANIDILGTLYNHYRTYPALDPQEILVWKQQYLLAFDTFFQENLDDEDVLKRRQIVKNTIHRLLITVKILKEFYDSQISHSAK